MTEPGGAALLRSLHVVGRPLVLPNVWDVATAVAVAGAGAPALATSSAALVEALGYEDHEHAPVGEVLAVVRKVAAAVDVPVTADMEAGYGLAPAELAERLADAGAVGLNFEDSDHRNGGYVEVGRQTERIAALKADGPDLVVNARIDMFLAGRPPDEVLDEAVERALRYREAGADCVYPIGLGDEGVIARFIEAVEGPVNILARRGVQPVSRLAEMGVARISVGGGLYRATLRLVRRAAEELLGPGTYDVLLS